MGHVFDVLQHCSTTTRSVCSPHGGDQLIELSVTWLAMEKVCVRWRRIGDTDGGEKSRFRSRLLSLTEWLDLMGN